MKEKKKKRKKKKKKREAKKIFKLKKPGFLLKKKIKLKK